MDHMKGMFATMVSLNTIAYNCITFCRIVIQISSEYFYSRPTLSNCNPVFIYKMCHMNTLLGSTCINMNK